MEDDGPETTTNRHVFVFRRFHQEQILEHLQLLWMLIRDVLTLTEILVEVVELPDVGVRRPGEDVGVDAFHPRQAWPHGSSHPAIVVDGSRAHDVEELGF